MVGKQIDLSTTKPVLSVAEGKTKIYLGFSWCCRVFVVFFLKMMPVGFTARKSDLALRGRGGLLSRNRPTSLQWRTVKN